MAQLIKLRDYISRYEWGAYRYPSQYIRLKQENWNKLLQEWHEAKVDSIKELNTITEKPSKFAQFKALFQKEVYPIEQGYDPVLPATELELRKQFLDELFPFQLKWATSTVTKVSFMDEKYKGDATLKYFLQRFPDIYLMMYYPVLNIKKAPIDCDIILISPLGIEIIYILEDDPTAIYMAGDERTWTMERNHVASRIISPLLSLRRTEQIVKSILNAHNIDFNINKVVLSRTNQIIYSTEPYKTNIIGKNQYEDWFNDKRNLSSPLKSQQLKIVETLLKYCISISINRPEWTEDNDNNTSSTNEL